MSDSTFTGGAEKGTGADLNRERSDSWLPIKTAPKDGTRVLVYEPRPDDDEYSRYDVAFWENGHWYGPLHVYTTYPTHWKPLTPPVGTPAKTNLADEAQQKERP